MEANIPDKPVPREIKARLPDERVILRQAQRAATPFGGLAVFVSCLAKTGLVEAVRQHVPVSRSSPTSIGAGHARPQTQSPTLAGAGHARPLPWSFYIFPSGCFRFRGQSGSSRS